MNQASTGHSALIGRFELKRELGKGGQATVWLAFDPRLEREVALKLMRNRGDTNAVNQWLREARLVSQLNHPNIVPVYEADSHDQQPYLVFEYVAGKTLAEHLRARKAMPARKAVEMMVGVLDALQVAHTAGVIHRDLKPSNILVATNSGRARVMDFGIAARMKDPSTQSQIAGTPGYMSPESTQGSKPAPGMDVFSAGLMLAEMLSGKQMISERDPYRAIYRVAHEDLELPEGTAKDGDDTLRGVVQRSLARDPAKRYPTAAEFRDALQNWLTPAPVSEAATEGNGTLDFLLRRMRHKTDFPALSDAVGSIQRVASSDSESIASLSTEILKDVALTNKLLRMVNAATYRHAGGGNISTVSRAVALIGFAGIRNMALSLVLLEHMNDKAHANQLREQFVRALMSGSLAHELAGSPKEGEEAFIGAMFQNLGRLLTEFYFPEEAQQIRSLVEAAAEKSGGTGRQVQREQAASITVLGLSYEELGQGIAKSWGLPENLRRCMRVPVGEAPMRACDKADRLQWIAAAANEMTDELVKAKPGGSKSAIARVADRYGKSIGLGANEMQVAAQTAQSRLVELAQAMSLTVQPDSPTRRLLEASSLQHTAPDHDTHGLLQHALQPTIPFEAGQEVAALRPGAGVVVPEPFDNRAAEDMLAAGIQDITNTMVDDFQINAVLRMILETMLRALKFRRVVFCLRDAKTEQMIGRFGLGDGSEAVSARFKLPLKAMPGTAPDLFAAVCNKGADTLIADATVQAIATRLPAWYREGINAPAFLLLPLMIKCAPVGLIYADKAQPGSIELSEKALSLLRTLRNQAVMAFKQAG